MSPKTQAKVLRVLQEGEVERLGSARTLKVDVRVIAATNKNLDEEIEKGTFREDLYFRLSVIPIAVPPLRERAEDIPLLVRHFTELFARENNFRPRRFTPAAMDLLQRHRWKGNIRELKNTVERLLIMAAGDAIEASDARDVLRVEKPPAEAGGVRDATGGTLREFREIVRARVPGQQAARERVEHLADRRGDRHAAQQPLQEAGAVRHHAGAGRVRRPAP